MASAGLTAVDGGRDPPAVHAARAWATSLTRSRCSSATGTTARLSAMLYEVHNTFGDRHSYLIPVEDPAAKDHPAGLRQGVLRLPVQPHGDDLCVPRGPAGRDHRRRGDDADDAEGRVLTASYHRAPHDAV